MVLQGIIREGRRGSVVSVILGGRLVVVGKL